MQISTHFSTSHHLNTSTFFEEKKHMTTFESTIRQINYPQQNVYNKLSDLSNLQALKERYELMKDTIPEEARQQAEKIKDMTFDSDSLSVNVPPVGSIRLRIVDRDEPKCIKFESEQSGDITDVHF
jgi:hypothetical protein